jgi:superfamily II DNA/RNA helicase
MKKIATETAISVMTDCGLFITGTGCIVISPTRELSMQTFGVLKELMKYHHHTYGLLMGGANRQTEAQKLSKGWYMHTAENGI